MKLETSKSQAHHVNEHSLPHVTYFTIPMDVDFNRDNVSTVDRAAWDVHRKGSIDPCGPENYVKV